MELLHDNARAIDVPDVMARFDRDGYALLGRVASDAVIEAMRARSDDIMLGRVALRGPLLPARHRDRQVRGARVRPRLGGPVAQLPQDREGRARPGLRCRGSRTRSSSRSRARASPGERRDLPRGDHVASAPRAARSLPWHQDGGTSGGSTAIPSCRSGRRSTTPPPRPGASRSSRQHTRQARDPARRRRSRRDRRGAARAGPAPARRAAPGARGRGHPHSQLCLAPLGRERDAVAEARPDRSATSRPRRSASASGGRRGSFIACSAARGRRSPWGGRPIAPIARPIEWGGRPIAPIAWPIEWGGRPIAPIAWPIEWGGRPIAPIAWPIEWGGRPIAPIAWPIECGEGGPLSPSRGPLNGEGPARARSR